MTYTPNDTVDLYGIGVITDNFNENTSTNEHPEEYGYMTSFVSSTVLPPNGSTGEDFYASVDFTTATTTSPTSSTFTGSDDWSFSGVVIYTPTDGKCSYIQYFGSMLFTMPDSFMGNSVTVTITTNTGDGGSGDISVNGQLHTFAPGETFIWTIPVTANGTIEFKSNGETYSADITRIVISSGNGSALNAPHYILGNKQDSQIEDINDSPIPLADSKEERNSETIIPIN
jgi:hypothetical protein